MSPTPSVRWPAASSRRLQVLISPLDDEGKVRLHLPDGVHDFRRPETGRGVRQQVVAAQIEAMARQEGADQVEVRMTRKDHWAPVAIGMNQEIYLGTELHFTAAGRPSPAAALRGLHQTIGQALHRAHELLQPGVPHTACGMSGRFDVDQQSEAGQDPALPGRSGKIVVVGEPDALAGWRAAALQHDPAHRGQL